MLVASWVQNEEETLHHDHVNANAELCTDLYCVDLLAVRGCPAFVVIIIIFYIEFPLVNTNSMQMMLLLVASSITGSMDVLTFLKNPVAFVVVTT